MKSVAPSFALASVLGFGLAGCASAPDLDHNAEVTKAVNAHQKEFMGCYRKFGAKQEVFVTVKYQINYAGDMRFVEIDPSTSKASTPAMDNCVLQEFKTLRMPEVQGYDGARGSYTFSFTTEK